MENRNSQSSSQRKRGKKGLSQDTPLTALSVEDKLRLAGEVEKRLSEESNEETCSKLRIQLCQYLSDVILSDPIVAVREDSIGRLWRVCFYARINALRGRINREAKKSKKESKAMFEDSLKQFLEEAIVLYEFMGKNLEDSVADMEESEGLSAIACIYRLLIHLGDLYRYRRSDGKAEGCYLRASRLSPGRGNSYNQLAVVAQQASLEGGHPKTCLALYWYARSLMASVEPFETSRSNLTRLFFFNRTWLQNNPPQTPVPGNKRLIANHKSFMLRRFMAEFVELQSFLLKMPDTPSMEQVVAQANSLFDNFKLLLQDQSFGDSLLAKMAVILMFVVVYLKSPEDEYPQLPLSCALRFGYSIASYLMSQPSSSSLRALSPLLVICLWLQNLPDHALSLKDTDLVNSKDFWSCIADLGNLLQATYAEQLADIPNDQRLPIETELLGFAPLFPEAEKKPSSLSGFLPLTDSIQLLSQESRNSNDQDSLRKVARFLLVLRNLSTSHSNKDAWPLVFDETFFIQSERSQNLGIDLAASANAPPEPMDDFADDDIVYTGSENDTAMEDMKKDDLMTNPYTSGLVQSVAAAEQKPKAIKPPPGFGPPITSHFGNGILQPNNPPLPHTGTIPGIIGAFEPRLNPIPPGFETFKLPTREAVNADFNQLSQWPPFLNTPMETPWPATANPFVQQPLFHHPPVGFSATSKEKDDIDEFQFLGSLIFDPATTGFSNSASGQGMDSPPATRNPFML